MKYNSEPKKPCPYCGNNIIDTCSVRSQWSFQFISYCYCYNCGVRGPKKESLENAILAWDSLPRKDCKDDNFEVYTELKPCRLVSNSNSELPNG